LLYTVLGAQDAMMVMDVWQEAWGPLPLDFEGMNLACQVLCISNTLATH
jgi:hypothetical protein